MTLGLILLVAAFSGFMSMAILARLARVERKLDKLERAGVLMTSESERSPVARPMSPRERIRWIERRMNGVQRATP